jgi:hypothetical protein
LFVQYWKKTRSTTKMAVFWVVAPCSLVEVYQRFRGPEGDRPDDGGSKDLWNVGKLLPALLLHGATTQKTAFFVLTALRTSNPTNINNAVRLWECFPKYCSTLKKPLFGLADAASVEAVTHSDG